MLSSRFRNTFFFLLSIIFALGAAHHFLFATLYWITQIPLFTTGDGIIAVSSLFLGIACAKTDRQELGISLFLTFAMIDLNPSWNSAGWWHIAFSPSINLFLLTLVPSLFFKNPHAIRSFFSNYPMVCCLSFGWLALWLARFYFSPQYDFASVLEGVSLNDWFAHYPHPRGLMNFLNCYSLCALFIWIAAFPIRRARSGHFHLLPLMGAAALFILYVQGSCIQAGDLGLYRLWGLRLGPNHLGFITMGLCFFYLPQLDGGSTLCRTISWIGHVATSGLTILTLSKSAMAGLFVGLLTCFALKRSISTLKALVAFSLLTLLVLCSLSFLHQKNYFSRFYLNRIVEKEQATRNPYSRLKLWSWGLDRALTNPILGSGDNWQIDYFDDHRLTLPRLEAVPSMLNFYLDTIIGHGLFELAIWLSIITSMILVAWKQAGREYTIALALASFVVGLFYNPFREANSLLIMFGVLFSYRESITPVRVGTAVTRVAPESAH